MPFKKTSVVFPGQGSQYVGMLIDYFDAESSFRNTFSMASEILKINLFELIKSGTKESLAATNVTQPLMLVSDLALWNLISNKINEPVCFAGHSLGEYAALVASEVLSFEDSLYLVKTRAKLMQEAVPEGEGGIAAIIGLNEKTITTICERISENPKFLVNPSNINTSTQIVISGTKLGVNAAIEESKELGAKRAVFLAMSVPSHSALMKKASETFRSNLQSVNFNPPKIPVLQNVDYSHVNETKEIKNKLVKQFYCPVRWEDTVNTILKLGVERVIECGPGKVLSSLINKISSHFETIHLDNYDNFRKILYEQQN